jgi:hypothetical protein
MRRQLAFMLARHQVYIDMNEVPEQYAADIDEDERETLAQLMSNVSVVDHFCLC